MKCWISNGFHRESQFRLPRPPYARSSSSIFDPLMCLCSGKTGLAKSQVGGSLGTSCCIPPSFQVFFSPTFLPLPGSPLVDITLFEVSKSSGTCGIIRVLDLFQFIPSLLNISTVSWFSFCSISHICALLSIPSSTSPIRKMLHLFDMQICMFHI